MCTAINFTHGNYLYMYVAIFVCYRYISYAQFPQ
jgi:hypothetical protein